MRAALTPTLLCSALVALLALTPPASAQTCALSFTIEITQGVGSILPGTRLPGQAQFTTIGQPTRAGGNSTAHPASGRMDLGDAISGPIHTLVNTSNGSVVDLFGVYARDIQGLSVVGIDFAGPMVLTLFGDPGSHPVPGPPATQDGWDRLDLRRSFTLHAQGYDMLAGDVVDFSATCS